MTVTTSGKREKKKIKLTQKIHSKIKARVLGWSLSNMTDPKRILLLRPIRRIDFYHNCTSVLRVVIPRARLSSPFSLVESLTTIRDSLRGRGEAEAQSRKALPPRPPRIRPPHVRGM